MLAEHPVLVHEGLDKTEREDVEAKTVNECLQVCAARLYPFPVAICVPERPSRCLQGLEVRAEVFDAISELTVAGGNEILIAVTDFFEVATESPEAGFERREVGFEPLAFVVRVTEPEANHPRWGESEQHASGEALMTHRINMRSLPLAH